MKLLFTSYVSTPEYNEPVEWLRRIEGFTGILDALSEDHDVTSIERINYEGEYRQNGVRYIFVRQAAKTVRFPFRMHRLIKTIRPDVVFVNGFIFPLQIIQLRMKLGKRPKIIVINQAEKPFDGIKGYIQKQADKCVDAHLFASAGFGEQWTRKKNISTQEKIHEILHGSSVFKPGNKEEARKKLGITGSPIFLFVGRLDVNKDPLTVIKAFIEFLKCQPQAELYMIYHTEDLLKNVDELIGTVKSIKLIGRVPHSELQDWYAASDFVVSGSHYEGGGIAICEAMSCGCIPLLTNIISFRGMTGGNCGLFYEAGNEQELLKILLQTRDMDRDKERTRVLEQFERELSFAAIGKKINSLITSLGS